MTSHNALSRSFGSAYGVGAVQSQIQEDCSEEPVAFASRTLSTSEENYSQLE